VGIFLVARFTSLQHVHVRIRWPGCRQMVDRGGSVRRRLGGEPDDDLTLHAPMTAVSLLRQGTAAAQPVAGLPAVLPATDFPLPSDGLEELAPEGADLRPAPLEGETDSRLRIDTLVAGSVGGNGRARDELLALIHPLVLKYCRARLGRQESLMGSADDVAQDVCMAVVSALPSYQLKGLSFRAFVYGIAAHKVTDAFRAIGRNRAEPVAELPDGPVMADGPEHRLLAAEMSARLGALLKHLTPRQREVLVLRLAVGMSAEETAQAVRSTPGAVRVTQHRALGRLRRILMGEAVARVLADPATDDPTADELRTEAARSCAADDPAADDRALDAVAVLLDGRAPRSAGRRPVPYRRG
jgi:RNA polymerase sigma-70 factor, ECF subfamily